MKLSLVKWDQHLIHSTKSPAYRVHLWHVHLTTAALTMWRSINQWSELTHWVRDKTATISQTTFSNAFSWKKIYEFRLRFHWGLFPKVRINNIPAVVQIMAWRRPDDQPLSEPMMFRLLVHICVTRLQWGNFSNEKWPSPTPFSFIYFNDFNIQCPQT